LLSSIADWVQLLTRAQQAGRHQFVEQQLHSLVEALRVNPTAVDARLAAKLTGLARECPLALRPRENMLVRACATLLRAAFSIVGGLSLSSSNSQLRCRFCCGC
jgi:hypothetical protein